MNDVLFWLGISVVLNVYLAFEWYRSARKLWELAALRQRFVILLSASRN